MRTALLFTALFILSACGPEESWEPPIPPAELPEVVADLLVLEAAVKEIHHAGRDSQSVVYYERALRPYGYTLDDFQESLRWMQEDPERMMEVYTEALNLLSVQEAELE